jgi:N-acetylglucosamine-6-sulfatase
VVLLVSLGLVASALSACSSSSKKTAATEPSTTTTTATNVPPPVLAVKRPNIVFVLTDDLSMNLVQYMPHVMQMEKDGATFSHYFVTDSLCCPSRTSILTGLYPHDSGVFTNGGSDGGFATFLKKGDTQRTYAVALQKAQYNTALMGKYLNGYVPETSNVTPKGYVPPGWSDWAAAGNGYPEFKYFLDQNHDVVHYGTAPKDYLTDVLSRFGTAFIAKSAGAKRPFVLESATFAPHAPYIPAPRDANKFPTLNAPETPAFDKSDTVGNPPWLKPYPPLTHQDVNEINHSFRKRVQSVQAVDRMIGDLEHEVAARGLTKSTYFVFSSDNGFHMGEHRMMPGKLTAFDTDIHVPLVVVGPGVKPGKTISDLAENIDLAPTFEQLAGAPVSPSVDGASLVSLLLGQPTGPWRKGVLVEHHGPKPKPGDPDFQPPASGNPPSYEALRRENSVYVEYVDGEHEFYNTLTDPYELRNIYGSLNAATRAELHKELLALRTCHGGDSCHRAQLLLSG